MDRAPKKRRCGEVKHLTSTEVYSALQSAITSQGSAELAILYLFDHYHFDPDLLKAHLQETGLQVSFSKVTYSKVAPFVGLNPTLSFRDVSTFQLHRARIPTSLFKEIVEDMQIAMHQYGPPIDHKNVQARSRFLAPIFNRTVAQFKLLLVNTFKITIPGRIATKEHIENHFLVLGEITVLFIEVKLDLGTSDRLDAIAQVIAESNACDYANSCAGFDHILSAASYVTEKNLSFSLLMVARSLPPFHKAYPPTEHRQASLSTKLLMSLASEPLPLKTS